MDPLIAEESRTPVAMVYLRPHSKSVWRWGKGESKGQKMDM